MLTNTTERDLRPCLSHLPGQMRRIHVNHQISHGGFRSIDHAYIGFESVLARNISPCEGGFFYCLEMADPNFLAA